MVFQDMLTTVVEVIVKIFMTTETDQTLEESLHDKVKTLVEKATNPNLSAEEQAKIWQDGGQLMDEVNQELTIVRTDDGHVLREAWWD
jgi:hypothetical protein